MRHYSTHEMVKELHDKALPAVSAKFIEKLYQRDLLGQITEISDSEIIILSDLFDIYHVTGR